MTDPVEQPKEQPKETPKEQPKTVTVKINGKEFPVDSSIADELKRYSEAVNAHIAELKKGSPKETPKKDDAKPKSDADKYNYSEKLFSDPDEAVAKLSQEIEAKIEKKYVEDQAQRQFWLDFYTEKGNAGLKKHHELVLTVLRKDYKELGDLPTGKAITELSKRVKSALKEAAIEAGHKFVTDGDKEGDKEGEDTPRGDVVDFVEGVSLVVDKSKPVDKSTPKTYASITEQLQARKAARREAALRGPGRPRGD